MHSCSDATASDARRQSQGAKILQCRHALRVTVIRMSQQILSTVRVLVLRRRYIWRLGLPRRLSTARPLRDRQAFK